MKIEDAVPKAVDAMAAALPSPSTTKPVEVESDERAGDERTVKKVVNRKIKTLKELAAVCEIDTSEWEIYKWKCGVWCTGTTPRAIGSSGNWKRDSADIIYAEQFMVTAWMRIKKDVIRAKNEIDLLRAKAIGHVPAPAIITSKDDGGELLAEYSITDHHIGALAWKEETGGPNYDLKTSIRDYRDALTGLMSRLAPYTCHRALIILGNDQQNIDNRAGTTEHGTLQNTDSRYQKVFGASRDVSIWAIESLLSAAEKVDVIIVSGNHDALAAWHLGDSLRSWFRENPAVHVDNQPRFRKYFQFGTNMLMFTHGNAGKLEDYGKIMAAEQSEMWGKTQWREAHTGDKHHRRLIELQGASVRILPSLRPPDAWTSEHCFIGSLRAAEAYVWHKTQGLVGMATHSILGKG